jgi:hypothetical protein
MVELQGPEKQLMTTWMYADEPVELFLEQHT